MYSGTKPWLEWTPFAEKTECSTSKMICYGCGEIYRVCLPVPLEIIKAITLAFEKLHTPCEYDFHLNTLDGLAGKLQRSHQTDGNRLILGEQGSDKG